jgi:hypothetical protein
MLHISFQFMIYTSGRRCNVISRKEKQIPVPEKSSVIQIRIKGHLGEQWADWFDGMNITLEKDGDTLLTGPVTDQATLHGLLKRIRDLGMPLVSINPILPERASLPTGRINTHAEKEKK